jgi:two-component system cell cycle sensor histidine kinase/response regulator CckA
MSQPEGSGPISRILVVEDDVGIAALERRALERHEYGVDVVHGAQVAIGKLTSGTYNAVVLDYRLADGDGWPVLDAARACVPPVPVVMVTGAGDEKVAAEAIHRGAADYLVKTGHFGLELSVAVDRVVRMAAMEQAAALLASVIESTEDAVITTTPDGRIGSWNRGATGLFGRTQQQVIGQPLANFLLFADASLPVRLFSRALDPDDAEGEFKPLAGVAPCVAACVTPEGVRRDLELTLSVVRNAQDNASYLAFIARDVTEQYANARLVAEQFKELAAARRAIEEELHARAAAERHFRILFEESTAAILVFRADLQIVQVNRRAVELFHKTHDQLIGRSITDLHRPEAHARVANRIALVLADANPGPVVLPLFLDDGSELLVEFNTSVIDVEGERLLLSMGRDVTAEVTGQLELKASEARYASLLEHIPDMVWRASSAGVTAFISPAVERILGFTPEEVYAGGAAVWPGRIHEDDAEAVFAVGAAAIAEGRPFDAKYRVRHKAGHFVWLHGRGVAVQQPNGSYTVEGLASDISETKRLEEQFLQAQRLEAVGQLTAGIAHDFNNLLAAILAGSSFIAADLPADHPSRNDALDIKAAAESAARLTRQLLAFSRKQRMSIMAVDVNEVLGQMERLLRRSISEDIALQTDFQADLPLVLVDAGQLEQVVMNLAVNARDAMPRGGTLRLTTAFAGQSNQNELVGLPLAAGAYVRISVRDTGEGMDAATIRHIFEPFFTTKEVGKGTGLGLSTCYGIVNQSGGCIEVDSELGAGTTFRVYLPCADASHRTESGPHALDAPSPVVRARVLLVEDNPAVLKAVSRTLRNGGHEVVTATCLAEAVAACHAAEGGLDMVITDVVMAGGTGPQVVEALRAIQPGLRAILMSGYANHPALQGAALPPGVAFMQKPFDPDALLRLVRDVLAE